MTMDWTGSKAAQRIDALEEEIARLRQTVADQAMPPPRDPAFEQIGSSLADFARRLSLIEARVANDGEVGARHAASTEADRKELTRLRVELMRIQLEMTRQEEQTRKLTIGLLERMEHFPAFGNGTTAELP